MKKISTLVAFMLLATFGKGQLEFKKGCCNTVPLDSTPIVWHIDTSGNYWESRYIDTVLQYDPATKTLTSLGGFMRTNECIFGNTFRAYLRIGNRMPTNSNSVYQDYPILWVHMIPLWCCGPFALLPFKIREYAY